MGFKSSEEMKAYGLKSAADLVDFVSRVSFVDSDNLLPCLTLYEVCNQHIHDHFPRIDTIRSMRVTVGRSH